MARIANIPYCKEVKAPFNYPRQNMLVDIFLDDQENIIGYFRGPELKRTQWVTRKNHLFLPQKGTKILIDKSFTKQCGETTHISILNFVLNLTKKISGNKIQVIFTGHGIGGVYALNLMGYILASQINGATLKETNGRRIFGKVVTFGQPRFGNNKFAQLFYRYKNDLHIFRVTHSNDFVSQYPKKDAVGEHYWHTETEYWIPRDNCECPTLQSEIGENRLYTVYKCPGYYPSRQQYGENPVNECNVGRNGASDSANFGPWFDTTFGDCRNFYPVQ
ncbi:hypothetical protein G9A89_004844 [Geosiphon pyriformis]|nr:hypothetical protein G9A89_004844 [Geosiphon pyriformis]